jgi:hypothetical protein
MLGLVIAMVLVSLSACGSQPATPATLPVYTGATELKEGESTLGSTLANNNQLDAQMRQAAGVGGKTEQKGFKLPSEATWDQVKGFYVEKLKADGWNEGMGGIAGSAVDVNKMMEAANQGNDTVKMMLFSKGSQTLTVIMLKSPVDATQQELILSLASQ